MTWFTDAGINVLALHPQLVSILWASKVPFWVFLPLTGTLKTNKTPWFSSTRWTFCPLRKPMHRPNCCPDSPFHAGSPALQRSGLGGVLNLPTSHSTHLVLWVFVLFSFEPNHSFCFWGLEWHVLSPTSPRLPLATALDFGFWISTVFCQLLKLKLKCSVPGAWKLLPTGTSASSCGEERVPLPWKQNLLPFYWYGVSVFSPNAHLPASKK